MNRLNHPVRFGRTSLAEMGRRGFPPTFLSSMEHHHIDESKMTLATDWIGQPMDGWYMTEKLDGMRAYWDGKQFWTRNGNIVPVPKWVIAWMPALPLDGELWAGRGNFAEARLAGQYGGKYFTENIQFVPFDAPTGTGTWIERFHAVQTDTLYDHHGIFLRHMPVVKVTSHAHLCQEFGKIKTAGGEGIMLRHPTAVGYEMGRSLNLIRIKNL